MSFRILAVTACLLAATRGGVVADAIDPAALPDFHVMQAGDRQIAASFSDDGPVPIVADESGPARPSVAARPARRRAPDVAGAVVAAAGTVAATSVEVADATEPAFGGPPSGSVPILFNDRHVYAKPDTLRRGRLLAALVRNGSILVPLRSLFEQLGASTEYDAASKTAYVHRPGTEVRVTVGRAAIDIDGVTRPLDVPPVIYAGAILVPVRVIAEAFGAYVAWLPDKRAVAIRYLAAPVAPASAPETPVPLSVATPLPTPAPRRTVGPGASVPKAPIQPETFIAIDPLISPRIANEFAPNVTGASGTSFSGRLASDFDFAGAMLEIDGAFTKYHYAHATGNVTVIGQGGQTTVPAFIANEYQTDVHVGVELSPEKFYLAIAYASQTDNYGYPRIGGLGAGLNKLPVLDRKISYEGSFFYYPNLTGTCGTVSCPSGPYNLSYKSFRYSAGLTALLGHKVFLEVGYRGDKEIGKAFAPANVTHAAAFGGLGVRF